MARRKKPRLFCTNCGRRISPYEFIGFSLDFRALFYRCRSCGMIIEVKNEERTDESG